MRLKVITLLLPALLLIRGTGGAITRHDPEGDACTLDKYEGGDGTVDISKCNQNFVHSCCWIFVQKTLLWSTSISLC